MAKQNNFFRRAIDALVESRTRQAERYVLRFQSQHSHLNNKVNGN